MKNLQTRNSPEFTFTFIAPDIVSPIFGMRGVGYLVKEIGNLTQQVRSTHVLSPVHLAAVVQHIARRNPVENANERPPQSREIALGLVLVHACIG